MTKKLILVDYENRQNLDLSILDSSYKAIIFVGHFQEEPRIKRKIAKKNRLVVVNYLKVNGAGKNGLDFHIAFKLGQIYENAPETECYILSADKGFDPLLRHFNDIGFSCRRIDKLTELPIVGSIKYGLNVESPELTICARCKQAKTVEHNGGRWCTNCGRFASPPSVFETSRHKCEPKDNIQNTISLVCSHCSDSMGTGDGVYDDGEWTCWACLGV
ncbi:MAG: PIN domain-containing protein [Methylophilaceae bacterium]